MTITHKINMDLARRGIMPQINAVQGDAYTRQVAFALFSEGKPLQIPSETAVLIRYRRTDGTGGTYDTLPDGTRAATISSGTVTVSITPEALTVPGKVSLVVSLIRGEQELSTFELLMEVQANHSACNHAEGENTRIMSFLPAPEAAKVGQFVMVEKIDEKGNVIKLKSVDPPSCDGISVQEVQEIVADYLNEHPAGNGEDGATFTPSVSDEGVLSWTNDKGLDNPDPVNIRGSQGEKGETGARGYSIFFANVTAGGAEEITVNESDISIPEAVTGDLYTGDLLLTADGNIYSILYVQVSSNSATGVYIVSYTAKLLGSINS